MMVHRFRMYLRADIYDPIREDAPADRYDEDMPDLIDYDSRDEIDILADERPPLVIIGSHK